MRATIKLIGLLTFITWGCSSDDGGDSQTMAGASAKGGTSTSGGVSTTGGTTSTGGTASMAGAQTAGGTAAGQPAAGITAGQPAGGVSMTAGMTTSGGVISGGMMMSAGVIAGGAMTNPVGGMQNPAGGMMSPGGMQNPVGGGQNPAGGMQNPAGGMQNPAGGMQNPAGGMQSPVGGMQNPVGGMQNPAGGMQNPAGGMQNPVGGMQNPAGGMQNPAGGMQNPVGGMPNPVGGMHNPVGGMQNPAGGMQNPMGGMMQAGGMMGPIVGACNADRNCPNDQYCNNGFCVAHQCSANFPANSCSPRQECADGQTAVVLPGERCWKCVVVETCQVPAVGPMGGMPAMGGNGANDPECIDEGESWPVSDDEIDCCGNLVRVEKKPNALELCNDARQPEYYCVDCGNGSCDLGENFCNCPDDCQPPPPPACVAAGDVINILAGVEQCCENLFPLEICDGSTVCSASQCGDGMCDADEACACPVDCNMLGGGMNGGFEERCFFTADCLGKAPPQNCDSGIEQAGGVWKCDPDRVLTNPDDTAYTPDGCGYTCLEDLKACNNDGDCNFQNSCRACPEAGACGGAPKVCFDPENQ